MEREHFILIKMLWKGKITMSGGERGEEMNDLSNQHEQNEPHSWIRS